MNKHYQIVIIGGGTAGVTVASRLLRKNQNLKEKIAIIDPADHHYYQPLWTLVGAGYLVRKVLVKIWKVLYLKVLTG
ncbi:FAD/NAD(P)-binding oxidoreductase [Staphylococcus aureus]|nr:FAD/NAD(P)-binding oxidoreductase [Staphylococcus aureus]